MGNQEIERKFLVYGYDYKTQAVSHSHIQQGYILSSHGRTVRVRIRDGKAYLTIKGPAQEGHFGRYEFETEVSAEDGKELMKLCEPGIIDKTRYLVPCGKHTFEVDEFYGDNAGLVMAEVELSDENEPFEKPDFIGMEVTGDKRFYNGHMRKMPFIVWRGTIPKEFRHIELE